MERNSEEYNRILDELTGYCTESGKIDQNLYVNYDVKRGLRDSTGKGVLTGLTEISDVIQSVQSITIHWLGSDHLQ